MKEILIALAVGILGFFIIISIQEYETFIFPFLKDTTQNYSEGEIENAVKSINNFNNLLKKAYVELSIKTLEELPAERAIIDRYIKDIEDYRDNNQKFSSVDFTTVIKDKFFLGEDILQLVQKEKWIYKIKGSKETEVNNFLIVYTLKRQNGIWLIDNMDFSEINEEQNL